MGKSSESPKTLSEAIERLETAGQSKAKDLKDVLEKDFEQILGALNDLKPFLSDLGETAKQEARERTGKLETKVKESPWIALGVIGFVAFVLGWLIGRERK